MSRLLRAFAGALASLALAVRDGLVYVHGLAGLAGQAVYRATPLAPGHRAGLRALLAQIEQVGLGSLAIVILVAFLTGAILVFQSAPQLKDYGQLGLVPGLVAVSVVRELGPVMTAIVVTGRVGAGFAAELGTMKVGEEVMALEALGLHPVSYLVVPRALALLVALPLLTAIAAWVGMAAGALVGWGQFGLSPRGFFQRGWDFTDAADLGQGLLKSVVFAAIIALVSCYRGLAVEGGAEGVGQETKGSVVHCIVLIIGANAVFAAFSSLG